jgi:hypothetical protein
VVEFVAAVRRPLPKRRTGGENRRFFFAKPLIYA